MSINLIVTMGFGNGVFNGSIAEITRIGFDTVQADNFFMSQIHRIQLIDNDTPANSIDINTILSSSAMPTQTQLFSGVTPVGSLAGFPIQAYVPLLTGGAQDGSREANKFTQYNSDYTAGDFVSGVDTVAGQLTTQISSGVSGSYVGGAGTIIAVTDILVGGQAVLKVTSAPSVDTVAYSVLQGDDEEINNGFQYAAHWRQIQSADSSGEYAYFDGGGTVPWPG